MKDLLPLWYNWNRQYTESVCVKSFSVNGSRCLKFLFPCGRLLEYSTRVYEFCNGIDGVSFSDRKSINFLKRILTFQWIVSWNISFFLWFINFLKCKQNFPLLTFIYIHKTKQKSPNAKVPRHKLQFLPANFSNSVLYFPFMFIAVFILLDCDLFTRN